MESSSVAVNPALNSTYTQCYYMESLLTYSGAQAYLGSIVENVGVKLHLCFAVIKSYSSTKRLKTAAVNLTGCPPGPANSKL